MKMRKVFGLLTVVVLAFLFIFAASGKMQGVKKVKAGDPGIKPQSLKSPSALKPDMDFGKIPLYFINNKGQVNAKARFYAKASRYTLWMTKEGLVFDSSRKVEESDTPRPLRGHPSQEGNIKYLRDVSRLMFVGANKNPEISAIEPAKLKVNYFIGNDKSKWHCDVPTSMAVLYKSLYKNIDLKVYGIEKQIEYDWIVKPGGDPGDIRFRYKNVKGTRIDDEGNLLIETDFGELMHKRPFSYQEGGNEKVEVKAEFKKLAENTYGFEVGAYDRSRELIIDPVVLAYSTYLGGGGNDEGWGIAVDGSGYAYVTGDTRSTDFPTLNQYHAHQGHRDAFVTKLDPSQSGAASLLYSTYLGGGSTDYSYGIAVDGSGNAYVTGLTFSTDFPTLNQYQAYQGNWDAFVTKLDTTQSGASSLLYSTYLGGGNTDNGLKIAVDGSGNAYVTGATLSTDFPTLNQYQADQGGVDAFFTKLDPSQSGAASLLYSTYLGGAGSDYGIGIAVDGSGNAYVTGHTFSTDFPTLNQYQTDPGDAHVDAFVVKLDPAQSGASSLLYSTYLGGGSLDIGYCIAVDGNGYAYVTGYTTSTDFPTLNQYQAFQGGRDVFVTKLDPAQSGAASLLYSTYLGGAISDYCYGIAVDGSGNAYVTGETNSTDFPTLNQYQADQGGFDAFVTKLDTTQSGASGLIYSTYLGGGSPDRGLGIAADGSGNAYVTGRTYSTDFPTINPYQDTYGGGSFDSFVAKLSFGPTASISVTAPNGGEEWAIGSVQNITWETTGSLGDLKITLWKGGQLLGNIADGIDPTSNSFAWTVGQHSGGTAPEGTDYTIEIEEIGSDILDSSDAPFTLFIPNEPPVAVCKNIKKEADENNEAYITAADVDGGSYDPDEGDEITLSLDNTGPFGIGTHEVTLTVTDQHGATDSCIAEVEVYANPSGVSNYIQNLPDDYFDKNADQRKKTFKSKLDAVQKLIDAGNYQEAIDKLNNDIRKKVDGKNKNAWIIDPTAQAILTAYIDSMIEYLTGLL